MPGADFEDLLVYYRRYLARVEPASVNQARPRLTAWLRDGVPDLRVRVVLPNPGPIAAGDTVRRS